MNDISELRRGRRYTLDIARDYKNRGYRVIFEPERSDLPAFLRGFHPDLLAIGDRESVVVEVKTRRQLADSRPIRDLEEHVKKEPGWRFELIVLPVEDAAERPVSLDAAAMSRLMSDVDVALSVCPRSTELALTLLTSTVEVALRQLAAREHVQIDEDSFAYLVKQLYVDGYLPSDQYEKLSRAAEIRKRVARGLPVEVLTPRQIEELGRVAKQLLRRVGRTKAKP